VCVGAAAEAEEAEDGDAEAVRLPQDLLLLLRGPGAGALLLPVSPSRQPLMTWCCIQKLRIHISEGPYHPGQAGVVCISMDRYHGSIIMAR
jgi:hypothetical protein